MTNPSTPTINHFVAQITSQPFENSQIMVENIADTLVDHLGLTVVNKNNYSFSPQGFTLVYILAQSHLIIHTWPESGLFNVDLETCSAVSQDQFSQALNMAFLNLPDVGFQIKSVVFE